MSTYLQYVYKTNNLDNLIKLESSKLYLNLKSAITKQMKNNTGLEIQVFSSSGILLIENKYRYQQLC